MALAKTVITGMMFQVIQFSLVHPKGTIIIMNHHQVTDTKRRKYSLARIKVKNDNIIICIIGSTIMFTKFIKHHKYDDDYTKKKSDNLDLIIGHNLFN